MRILLTGATGLVGQALAPILLKKGHELVVVSRTLDNLSSRFPFPCSGFSWNPLTGEIPPQALKEIDAVIHLAGEPVANKRWNDQVKQSIYDSRAIATDKLMATLNQCSAKPHTFISASAIGYYDDGGDTRITEARGPGSSFLAKVCIDWEEAVHRQAWQGLRTAIFRIGLVLSQEGGILRKISPIFRKGFGGRLDNGQHWMSWVHIEDLVRGIVHVLEDDRLSGVFNGTAPNPVTNKVFTKELSSTLKVRAPFPAPRKAIETVTGEMATMIFASQRVLPKNLLESGFEFEFPQLRDAFNSLFSSVGSDELFIQRQWLNHDISDVFAFFSQAKNLEAITPSWLKFKVLGQTTEQIEEGTLINYKLSLRGLPVSWQSKIIGWNPPQSFVDTQTKGPYRKWHHTHTFEQLAGGTLIADRVRFKVPGGLIGNLIVGPWVKRDISQIFKFRFGEIEKRFPNQNSQN